MPIYMLDDGLWFPNPRLADDEGIVAVGGDLRPERLLLAYQLGIFPWYSQGEPIVWWSPNPRFVLRPQQLKIRRSLRKVFKQNRFRIGYDTNFEAVIDACAHQPRPGQDGTWLVPAMRTAYLEMHRRKVAHSVEIYDPNDQLVGGLYGLAIGRLFFGESMFHIAADASKCALAALCQRYSSAPFIDCQVANPFFRRMGAQDIPRDDFLKAVVKYTNTADLWLATKDEAPRESAYLVQTTAKN